MAASLADRSENYRLKRHKQPSSRQKRKRREKNLSCHFLNRDWSGDFWATQPASPSFRDLERSGWSAILIPTRAGVAETQASKKHKPQRNRGRTEIEMATPWPGVPPVSIFLIPMPHSHTTHAVGRCACVPPSPVSPTTVQETRANFPLASAPETAPT